MPKIPTYTATGKSTPEEYPRDVPTEDFSSLAAAQPALSRISQETAQIVDYYNTVDIKNQNVRAKLETSNLRGGYDALLKEQLDVMKTDPNIKSPDDALLAFNKAEQQARVDILKRAQSPITKYNIDLHINDTIGANRAEARHIGRQSAVTYNVGLYETNQDRLLNLAVSDPANAAEYRNQATADTDDMRKNGYINDIRQGKDKLTFRDNMFDRQADFMMTGPGGSTEMFRESVNAGKFGGINPDTGKWDENGMTAIDMSKKLIKARDIDESNLRKEEQEHTRLVRTTKASWDADAFSGRLSAERIQNAKDGNDPLILPHEAAAYEKIQLSPPDARTDLTVHNIEQEYGRKTATIERVNQFRARVNGLGVSAYNEQLSQFLGRLQHDEGMARSLNNQQINDATREALEDIQDRLKEPKTGLGGFVDRVIDNMNEVDKAEVQSAVHTARRNGGSAESIREAKDNKVEEILKRRKDESNSRPDSEKRKDTIYKR